eukprot:TRINITY_DN9928_c0_g1_i1.p1 TRINITY_DN9928_c0_g1~~TRINITY_DN9928_c0_g1_i1.p1  ORF type:complete len:422 (-),score=98.00 TRINITY_DN9928_c0_g1_i1:421-1686(-)
MDRIELLERLARMEQFQLTIYRGIVERVDTLPLPNHYNLLKQKLVEAKDQSDRLEKKLDDIERKLDFFLPTACYQFRMKQTDNDLSNLNSTINQIREEVETMKDIFISCNEQVISINSADSSSVSDTNTSECESSLDYNSDFDEGYEAEIVCTTADLKNCQQNSAANHCHNEDDRKVPTVAYDHLGKTDDGDESCVDVEFGYYSSTECLVFGSLDPLESDLTIDELNLYNANTLNSSNKLVPNCDSDLSTRLPAPVPTCAIHVTSPQQSANIADPCCNGQLGQGVSPSTLIEFGEATKVLDDILYHHEKPEESCHAKDLLLYEASRQDKSPAEATSIEFGEATQVLERIRHDPTAGIRDFPPPQPPATAVLYVPSSARDMSCAEVTPPSHYYYQVANDVTAPHPYRGLQPHSVFPSLRSQH